MSTWRIHLSWAAITLIAAGVWGRYTASHQHEDGWRTRPSDADRNDFAGSARPDSSTPASRSFRNGEEPPATPLPGFHPGTAGGSEALSAEEIRTKLRSPDPDVSRMALRAIERLPTRPLKLDLCKEVLSFGALDVRSWVVDYLERVGGEGAAALLAEVLLKDQDAQIRQQAAWRLGADTIAGPSNVAPLFDAYHGSDSMPFRAACAASLYKLGQESPAFEVVLQLGRLLESPDGGTRRAAVENLGCLGSPVAIPLLAQAIRDSNSDVRSSAVDGLFNTRSPEAIPILEGAVNDSNREVAEQAREVIARLRSPTGR